jgi:hypothetical protein
MNSCILQSQIHFQLRPDGSEELTFREGAQKQHLGQERLSRDRRSVQVRMHEVLGGLRTDDIDQGVWIGAYR